MRKLSAPTVAGASARIAAEIRSRLDRIVTP
jgi:hypothetical protein